MIDADLVTQVPFGILLELEPSTFATGYVPAEYLKKVMGLGFIAENVPRVHVISHRIHVWYIYLHLP